MIKFPLNPHTRVEFTDRKSGVLISIVIDAAQQKVVHFVVQDNNQQKYLVPLNVVYFADDELVKLSISSEDFFKLAHFDETQFVVGADPDNDFFKSSETASVVYYIPDLNPEQLVPPEKDLALIRGAFVNSQDGMIGTIEEIVIDPKTGSAAQIVVHTERRKEELVLPITVIDHLEGDTVYIKLSKKQVESLPGVPVEYTKTGKLRYEVLIKVFDSVDGARSAHKEWKQVWSKQARNFIHSAAILERDEKGEFSVKDTADVDKRQGRIFGAIAGGLVGLVGGPVGVVVGALAGAGTGGIAADKIDRGFSDEFLERFVNELKPGTSALILMVDREGVPSIAESIKGLSGTMLQQELTDQFIQEMLGEGNNE
jgi:uncharacterized membrane protein